MTIRTVSLSAVLTAALAGAVALPGCRTTEPTAPRDETPVPAWGEIVAAQQVRLERLLPLRAAGAVELTWRDERGRRFENCRGDLMLRTPVEAALDLRKVGERFLLVGSDATRQWVFDVRRGEEQAWIRERGSPWSDSAPPIPSEVDLAELFGLIEMPPTPLIPPRWNVGSGEIEVLIGSTTAPRRLLLDAATLLPNRLEVLDPIAGVLVEATMESYEPVEREGLPPGDRPRFPTRVRLRTGDGNGEIALFLIPPDTTPRIPERLLSLDALLETFRPPVINRSPNGTTSSAVGDDGSRAP